MICSYYLILDGNKMMLCSGPVPVSGVQSRVLYGASSGPALTGFDFCPQEETDVLSCIKNYLGEFLNCNLDPEIQFPTGVRCEREMIFESCVKRWRTPGYNLSCSTTVR